jgi:hypothetical protein
LSLCVYIGSLEERQRNKRKRENERERESHVDEGNGGLVKHGLAHWLGSVRKGGSREAAQS